MKERHIRRIRHTLTGAIQKWLDNDSCGEDEYLPWLGENTAAIMADAATAVLLGMQDAEDYLTAEGMLKE